MERWRHDWEGATSERQLMFGTWRREQLSNIKTFNSTVDWGASEHK